MFLLLFLLLLALQGYLKRSHSLALQRSLSILPLLYDLCCFQKLFPLISGVVLSWYLATDKEIGVMCVCVSSIVGIVAWKYHGLLCVSKFA